LRCGVTTSITKTWQASRSAPQHKAPRRREFADLRIRNFTKNTNNLSPLPPASSEVASVTSPATKEERYADEIPVAVTSTAEAAVSIRWRCRCGQSESRYADDTENLYPDITKSIGEDNGHHRQPTNHECSDTRANAPCHGSYLVTNVRTSCSYVNPTRSRLRLFQPDKRLLCGLVQVHTLWQNARSCATSITNFSRRLDNFSHGGFDATVRAVIDHRFKVDRLDLTDDPGVCLAAVAVLLALADRAFLRL
jgi:hypothetical protein